MICYHMGSRFWTWTLWHLSVFSALEHLKVLANHFISYSPILNTTFSWFTIKVLTFPLSFPLSISPHSLPMWFQVRGGHNWNLSGIWHQRAATSRLRGLLQGRCCWTLCILSQTCCWQGAPPGPTALPAAIELLQLLRVLGRGHIQLCSRGCWLISQVAQITGTGGSAD